MADYYTFRKWSVTAHGHEVAVVGPGDRVLDLQQRLSPKGPRASVSRRGQNGLIAATRGVETPHWYTKPVANRLFQCVSNALFGISR